MTRTTTKNKTKQKIWKFIFCEKYWFLSENQTSFAMLFLLIIYIVIECTSDEVYVVYVFTRMPGESYRRGLGSLLYLCYVFRALINSLVFWFCASALGLVLFHIRSDWAVKWLFLVSVKQLCGERSQRQCPKSSRWGTADAQDCPKQSKTLWQGRKSVL